MPTTKPRITISLTQETYDVISALAALQGVSKAYVVGDIMESVSGSLGRTVALLQAAAEAPEEVKRGLVQSIESIHGELVASCGESTERLQGVFEGFEEVLNPRIVTRGSDVAGSGGLGSEKPSKIKGLASKRGGGRV